MPPRIAEADRLIPEDLLMGSVEGEWVRVPMYAKGHRVSRVGHTAWCGLPLIVDEQWWDQFQAYLRDYSGYDNRAKGPAKWQPSEWYIARDRRKGDKCKACKTDIMFEDREDESPKREATSEDYAPFGEPTPADRMEHQRFLTKVAYVARELNATIVEDMEDAA